MLINIPGRHFFTGSPSASHEKTNGFHIQISRELIARIRHYDSHVYSQQGVVTDVRTKSSMQILAVLLMAICIID